MTVILFGPAGSLAYNYNRLVFLPNATAMCRLLLLLLLAPAALAQDGIVSFAETDQAEYAYGETIELRYTISNGSDEAFTLTGSNHCQAGFAYGSLSYPLVCDLEFITLDFPPHASRTWVWQLAPNELGVPEATGEQTITAYYGDTSYYILPATASFAAPRYLGGRVVFRLEDGRTLDDVQDVLDALNAVVVDGGGLYYFIEIEGVTLAEAVATYAPDPRFQFFEAYRELYYAEVYTVDADDSAAPLVAPALTAASPNPFVTSTSFALTVPAAGPAKVEVFDLLGRRVAVLHDGPLSAAEHAFTFRAASLPAGLYVVRASGEGFVETRRVMLAR